MFRNRYLSIDNCRREPSLADFLTARPSGLTEPESWAVLCQAVQALQDLFLSDNTSRASNVPLVTPASLFLLARGRVALMQNHATAGFGVPLHLSGYLAPEYRPNKYRTDIETEKMWIYALGETLKRATLTSHAATSRISGDLCKVLADMTKPQAGSRASLMYLLDVISDYCKKRQQKRPFSHIVMDLYQEAMASIESIVDVPWGPPAMPELRPRSKNRCESNIETIPRRWMWLPERPQDPTRPKLTREVSTSIEDLTGNISNTPGTIIRPKSMCAPDIRQYYPTTNNPTQNCDNTIEYEKLSTETYQTIVEAPKPNLRVPSRNPCKVEVNGSRRQKLRRNPVQRAASRLYRAESVESERRCDDDGKDSVGPEFVVRAALPSKQYCMAGVKGSGRRTVTVIMLNGQKVDVICNVNATTAGQLFELIIEKEHIEENFMLGLAALIAGDFVFLPSDTRICKAFVSASNASSTRLTLFVRVRFYLPSLRGLRSTQARHLLYLQLRRSILEYQLPCSLNQIIELNGLALQAEFGNFNEREHGGNEYFLLEHYVPETMACAFGDVDFLRGECVKAHRSKYGMDCEKAEHDFITLAQTLPHYGGHFYTATWVLKDGSQKDAWLYVSTQGINIYEREAGVSHEGPRCYEMFEWNNIQTLCYSKYYLCILPHANKMTLARLKKYKLKMNHKKSYFAFRLASLHHQFFLRLRTEYASLQSLSQQFGVPLKEIKNKTNSLYKLEALTNPLYSETLDGTVNAETEFQIEFCTQTKQKHANNGVNYKRSKSVSNFDELEINEKYQNKENENCQQICNKRNGLILDSSCLSGMPSLINPDKRRGVKMGVRAFGNVSQMRVCRSMEAVNTESTEDLEQLSLHSVSLCCSSPSTPKSAVPENDIQGVGQAQAYILDSTIRSCSNQFLPDFQETLSESLVNKLNDMSFAEERILRTVTIERDSHNSLGMQITEGSDGKVYVQTVIPGGPAHLSGSIFSGDQIIAVDGQNLLSLSYEAALALLKNTGEKVQFIVSHSNADTTNKQQNPSPVEKYLIESCYDASNSEKHTKNEISSLQNTPPAEVPYHKHIRYEIEPERDTIMLQKNLPPQKPSPTNLNKIISKSCDGEKVKIVGVIPKREFSSLDQKAVRDGVGGGMGVSVALPRSLGLGRRWRGPVRYPVTPVKKDYLQQTESENSCSANSEDEQVFF